MKTKVSLLELARLIEGSTVKETLDKAQKTAQHIEQLGFHRVWVAEHHNMGSICSAATSLVVSHLAAATSTIRVGAGGIMLPNHSPYVIAGLTIIAADTDKEARRLATSQQMSFANMVRGNRLSLQPPIDDIESYWSGSEKEIASRMLACSVIGDRATVRKGVLKFIESTAVNEVMVVTDTFDINARHQSLSITMEVFKSL